METTLHATPRWRDVVVEQIRIVRLSLVPAALVVAAVLAIGTVVIGGEIIGGGRGFDSEETFPTALIAFLYPFAVWRNEKRFGPGFLWTFPVERRLLALAKVFAGLVWFMAALAFFVLWLLALGRFDGASAEQTVARIPFVATIAMYLFGSAVVVGLRHPLRWLLGAGGVLFLMGTISDVLNRPNGGDGPEVGASSTFPDVVAAWLTLPDSAQATATTFVWVGAGLFAVWAAASRHRDRRRH